MPTPDIPVFYDGQPGPEIRRALNEMGALFVAAIEGAYGPQGWSPVLAMEADGERRVFAVVDWTGGQGTKPTLAGYLGPAGIVANIGDAVDVRGVAGLDGREVQLQVSAAAIQWRYAGDTVWTDLVPLADLEGADGREIELQTTGTHIQWRYVGGAWANLIPLTALQGAPGSAGWTPVFGTVVDGERRVQQVVDWLGGTGAKPVTGLYVGPAGLTPTLADATDIRGASGSGAGDMLAANNLSDLADAAAARANLGLGTAATRGVGTSAGTVAAGNDARMSDARTPLAHTHELADLQQSGATMGQVPKWDGSAWVPADDGGAASWADITDKPAVIAAGADTAAARAAIDAVAAVAGKGLSTEDYTTADKTKLAGIAAGAIADAPSDGKQYGRKDGAWSESTSGGGAVGSLYTGINKPSDGSWQPTKRVYLKSSYPAIVSQVGIQSDNPGAISSWFNSNLPTSGYWENPAFANGVFVVVNGVSSAQAYRSTDLGVTWQSATLPSSGYWQLVAHGNRFFAVSTTGTATAYSDDLGANWLSGTPVPAAPSSACLLSNGATLAVLSGSAAYLSTDGGGSWTTVSLPISGTWRGVSAGNRFIACSGTNAVYSDDQGLTWQYITVPVGFYFLTYIPESGRIIGTANSNTNQVWVSHDGGLSWYSRLFPTSQTRRSLCYGAGILISVCDNTSVLSVSQDQGDTWLNVTLSQSARWAGSAYGNGVFFVVSNNTSTAACRTGSVLSYDPSTQFYLPGTATPLGLGQWMKLAE